MDECGVSSFAIETNYKYISFSLTHTTAELSEKKQWLYHIRWISSYKFNMFFMPIKFWKKQEESIFIARQP